MARLFRSHLVKQFFPRCRSISNSSIFSFELTSKICRSVGAVGQSVRPASGRLNVRIPVSTDLGRKTGSDSSTAKRSTLGVSVTEMTIINGCPVSQYVWHAKEHSLLYGHKCRTQVKICNPSPARRMKNSQQDEKLQTNKTS